MSVLENHPDPGDDREATWPRPELLFPARQAPSAPPEPATEPWTASDPGALRPSAPEPPTAVLATPAATPPAPAPRKRSVLRGSVAAVEFVVLVAFAGALVAALVAGGLLLLTMALRAAST